MFVTLGSILIVTGFILGVYCGVVLSLPRVISPNKEVKQGKLAAITVLCCVSVVMVFVGQLLFFNFAFDPLKY